MFIKRDKNNKTMIALFVIGILSVFVGVSYSFIEQVISGQKQVVINAGVLDLVLEEENEITISNALPMADEVGMIQEDVFVFRLVNNTSNSTNYKLKLVDITPETLYSKCDELGEITPNSPDECRTVEYPTTLRTEALTICQGWYSGVTNEEDCIEANLQNGYSYSSFEDFIDEVISYGEVADTRTVVETYPDNYVTVEFPRLDDYTVRYGLIKEGVTSIDYVSAISEDNVIDLGTIASNETLDYELRLWINHEITNENDIKDKSLSFRIDVEVVQDIELAQECFDYEVSNYVVTDYKACSDYMLENVEYFYGDDGLVVCTDIVEDISYFRESYETQFQEMLANGIIQEGNQAVITGYNCTSDIVEIPETLEVDATNLNQMSTKKVTVPVVGIGYNAFGNYVIPNSTETNNYSAQPMGLSSLSSLSKVIIPDTVKFIDYGAFSNVSLKEVELSDNLLIIAGDAFSQNNLKSVVLPDTLISVGNDAFSKNSISKITLPESLYLIGEYAFHDNLLKRIVIPKNITVIEDRSFSTNLLEEIVLPEGVAYINIDAFAGNNLKTVTIPSTVIEIGSNSFLNNPSLTNIINKTGLSFNWHYICFGVYGNPSFAAGTLTNSDNTQTITVTSE